MIFEENLKQLYYFYIVGLVKNFSIAAKKLYISQPAISMQIKNLEKALGIKLIKSSHPFQLTSQGEMLHNSLVNIFKSLCETEERLLAFSLKDLKKITIGMSEAYSKHFIVDILEKFKHKYPEVGLKFFTENSVQLIEKIFNNSIDIAIVGEIDKNITDKSIVFEDVKKEEILVVSASENSLAKKEKVTEDDLLKERIILKDENSATRNFINKVFPKLAYSIYIECESSDILKKLVKLNNGVTFLTKTNVKKELENGELKQVNFYKKLYMPIKIVYRKELTMQHSAKFLINIITTILKEKE